MTTSSATELWLRMIVTLGPERSAAEPKPMSPAERSWMKLIRSRAPRWETETLELAMHFAPAPAPEAVRVVVGNQGGEDAFTADASTIGFDVARLSAAYGDAQTAENEGRIDRFFRHEYAHLLQKSWLAAHPHTARTPFESALLGMWLEGLGHYYSLSDRWRTVDGRSSASSERVLATLEPRFMARLAALACTTGEQAQALSADLSWGRFEQKWGALPVALWLEREASHSSDALRRFVKEGPDGILQLAERQLPEYGKAVLREIRASAVVCEEH